MVLDCGGHLKISTSWKSGGLVTIEGTTYRYKWPEADLKNYPPWNTFCLIIDRLNKSLSLVVNGNIAPIQNNLKIGPDQPISCPVLILSGLVGQATDLNMWNKPLIANDIKSYATGCNDSLLEREEPKLVFWPQLNFTWNGPVSDNMNKMELCYSNKLKNLARCLARLSTPILKAHTIFG